MLLLDYVSVDSSWRQSLWIPSATFSNVEAMYPPASALFLKRMLTRAISISIELRHTRLKVFEMKGAGSEEAGMISNKKIIF